MAWESTADENGIGWAVDWDGVARIVRAYCRSEAILANKTRNEEKQIIGPNLITIDVDWKKVHEDVDENASELLYRWQSSLQRRLQFNYLIDYRARTRSNEAQFHALQTSATKETFANIQQSVGRGEEGVKWATRVRDVSAGTLVAAATVISGGAAAAALGAGGVLKGVGKYQDTGNVGQAILETTSTVVIGMFDLPLVANAMKAGASVGQKVVMKFVVAQLDAQLEAAKTLAEGGTASVKGALAAGLAKGGLSLGGEFLEKVAEKALPIVVKIIPRKLIQMSPKETVKTAKALIRFGQDSTVDATVKVVEHGASGHGEHGAHGHGRAHDGGRPAGAKNGAGKQAVVPFERMADTLHTLITGPGTDVEFVNQTAMRQLR